MLKRRREPNPNVLAGAGPSATSAAHSRRSRRTDVRGLAMKPRGRGGPERPPGSPEARRLWRGHKEGGRRGGTGSLRRGPGEEAACHLLALLAAPIAIIPWPGDGLCLDTPAALPPPRNGSAMDTDPVTEDSAQPPSSEAWELGMQRGPGVGLAQDCGALASEQRGPGDEGEAAYVLITETRRILGKQD